MDFRIERWINGPAGHHAGLDALMRDAATWGQWVFLALIAGWFVLGWARGRGRERQGALTALVAGGGALLVNQVLSHLWGRDRPFADHPGVHLLIGHGADGSFPSDHAAAAFAIAAVLFVFHRRLGVLALVAAALMGLARIYVGVHYPADVLVGALVGIAVAAVLVTWLARLMSGLRLLVDRLIRALRMPLPHHPQEG
jgi:membrane-associated phospholipid phosphatase